MIASHAARRDAGPPAVAAAIALALLSSVSAAAGADEWRPDHEKSGVQVSTRSVPGTDVREVRGVGLVAAPPERVLAVLADVASYPYLMPPTILARELRRAGYSAWYYMVVDPPWVRKRDYCIKVTLSALGGGAFRSVWELAREGCPPAAPAMIRIDRAAGRWTLQPVASGTHLTYESLVDPGGAAPTWAVNRVTAHSVPALFEAVRRVVWLPRYARCSDCPRDVPPRAAAAATRIAGSDE